MIMSKVESSNLDAVGYSAATRTLRVRFKNGTTYAYSKVDPYLYEGLLQAESHGHYLARNIRPFHTAAKIPEDELKDDETAGGALPAPQDE